MSYNYNRTEWPLWSGKVPFASGSKPEDTPTITGFFPIEWKKNGKSIVILPGGGYRMLADHEGTAYAEFLADHGYTAFVVKYRLGTDGYHYPVQLADAARGVRFVRANAKKWGLRPDCIGLMGSSAGGHLTACTATYHEQAFREEEETEEKNFGRPDFMVLCYPVITCDPSFGHVDSFRVLLGDKYDDEALRNSLSMEKAADAQTPHAFIFHTWGDTAVPIKNTLRYVERLKELNVTCDLHIYVRHEHGLGLGEGHPWSAELIRWLDLL